MANINMSYDEMNPAANRLVTGGEGLESTLSELIAFIANLVSSGFVTDQASGRFHESMEAFTQGARVTISSLNSLGDYLNHAADTLRATDEQLSAQAGF